MHRGDRALVLILVLALHVAGLWLLWVDNWAPQLRGRAQLVSAMILVPAANDSRKHEFRRALPRLPALATVAPPTMPSVPSVPAAVANPDSTQSSIDWSAEARRAAMVAAQGAGPIESHPKSKAPSVWDDRIHGVLQPFDDTHLRLWVNDQCYLSLGGTGPSDQLGATCELFKRDARGDLFSELPEYRKRQADGH